MSSQPCSFVSLSLSVSLDATRRAILSFANSRVEGEGDASLGKHSHAHTRERTSQSERETK